MSATKKIAIVLAIAVAALLPTIWPNPYYVHLMVVIGIYAILLLGLDIVVGYVGEISLGHAALFGIGSYTVGVLNFQLGVPFLLAIPASIAVTAIFGAILALPALRVNGPYLAMVTLAFGTIIQILINEMDFLTNGPMGLSIRKPIWFGHQVTGADYYYIVLLALVLTLFVVQRILKSHLGRAFEALHDSPVASDCMGVSVYGYKVYAFVLSAGIAGLAGGLYTYSEEYISPNTYNFELTILFLLAVIMGGRKNTGGADPGGDHHRDVAECAFRYRAVPQDLGRHRCIHNVVLGIRRDCRSAHHETAGAAVAGYHRVGGIGLCDGQYHRPAPDDIRRDDPVRGVLPAERHYRLPARYRTESPAAVDTPP